MKNKKSVLLGLACAAAAAVFAAQVRVHAARDVAPLAVVALPDSFGRRLRERGARAEEQ
jgi:hypothetical protein